MAKFELRLQAHRLRRQGMSIKSIAKVLGVSSGSVSVWCQDIILTAKQRDALTKSQIKAGLRGRIKGAETNRQKRLTQIAQYEKEATDVVDVLSLRDTLMLGLGLYWGEGVKSRSGQASLVNSDPATILFAMKWFQECLGVPKEDFRPYIYISEIHRGREEKIIKFWSKYLGLPRVYFHDIIFIKGRPKKVYENHNSYYGVVALRVRRGTGLKYRILGLLKACKEDVGVAQLVGAGVS